MWSLLYDTQPVDCSDNVDGVANPIKLGACLWSLEQMEHWGRIRSSSAHNKIDRKFHCTKMAASSSSHLNLDSRPIEVSEQTNLDGDREPCPPPLAWQQILEAFRTESDCWELDREQYVLRGRSWGTGPPLYFLCGWSSTYEMFVLSVWLLRQDFRCVLYDYPNCERNCSRPPKLSINDFTADLLAITDLHHDTHVNVYATSFGSAIALSAMHKRPHMFQRAVIQGGFVYRRLTVFEQLLLKVCWYLPGRLRQVPWRDRFQQRNHRHWFPSFDRSRWQFFLENTGQSSIASLAARATVVKDLDLRTELHQIRQPIQIIHSEGDGRIIANCQQELEKGLPNATIESLHTCGQIPYLTHPHRLTNLIRPFLLGKDQTVAEMDDGT